MGFGSSSNAGLGRITTSAFDGVTIALLGALVGVSACGDDGGPAGRSSSGPTGSARDYCRASCDTASSCGAQVTGGSVDACTDQCVSGFAIPEAVADPDACAAVFADVVSCLDRSSCIEAAQCTPDAREVASACVAETPDGDAEGAVADALERYCTTSCQRAASCGAPLPPGGLEACIGQCASAIDVDVEFANANACAVALDAAGACFDVPECTTVPDCADEVEAFATACVPEGGAPDLEPAIATYCDTLCEFSDACITELDVQACSEDCRSAFESEAEPTLPEACAASLNGYSACLAAEGCDAPTTCNTRALAVESACGPGGG